MKDLERGLGAHRQTWGQALEQGFRERIHDGAGLITHLFDVRIEGAEHLEMLADAPVIIAFFPHTGHTDSVFVREAVPGRLRNKLVYPAPQDYWYADRQLWSDNKKEYLKKIFLSFIGDLFTTRLPIARSKNGENQAAIAQGIKKMLKALNDGDWLVMSPEGTRDNAHIPLTEKPLHDGIADLILHKPDTQIVPVLLQGLEDAMPKGSLWPQTRVDGHRRKVQVIFGEPIKFDLSELQAKSQKGKRQEMTETLRDKLLRLSQDWSGVETI